MKLAALLIFSIVAGLPSFAEDDFSGAASGQEADESASPSPEARRFVLDEQASGRNSCARQVALKAGDSEITLMSGGKKTAVTNLNKGLVCADRRGAPGMECSLSASRKVDGAVQYRSGRCFSDQPGQSCDAFDEFRTITLGSGSLRIAREKGSSSSDCIYKELNREAGDEAAGKPRSRAASAQRMDKLSKKLDAAGKPLSESGGGLKAAAALNAMFDRNSSAADEELQPRAASPDERAAAARAARAIPSGVDLKAVDKGANPCADFYQHACGSWLKNNPIPPDQSRWGRFSELDERIKGQLRDILAETARKRRKTADDRKLSDLYSSCMDEKAADKKGAAPIKPDLDRIAKLGGAKDLGREMARLQKSGIGALFSFGSQQDFGDSSSMIAAMDQGGITLPREYYIDPKYEDDMKAYQAHIAKMLELSGAAPGQAAAEARQAVEVETKLASISMDRVSRRDPANVHHKMSLSDFKAMTPSFDWDGYLSEIGAPVGKMGQIDVNDMKFFSQLGKTMAALPPGAWKAYLRWQVAHGRAGALSSAFADENFAFFGRRLSGQEELAPRWKRCVSRVDKTLGEILGKKFVERHFNADDKDTALRMIAQVEEAMRQNIGRVDWMGGETKRKAFAKLDKVGNKIGYPDKWRDYSALSIARGDLAGNAARASAFETARDLAKIGRPTDRKEWFMSPPTVNAYYSPDNNDINFPAGILQPPFYNSGADLAVSYGGIGAVEAHELIHGFDDQGRRYDGDGNMNEWWTQQDAGNFKKRAGGFVEQYAQFVARNYPGSDAKQAGQFALGEIIADNGGMHLAYEAYMKTQAQHPSGNMDGFSPEQRFFMGFGQIWCNNQTEKAARMQLLGDPHPLTKFRVNGTVSNMPEFKKAFSCGANAPMVNPAPSQVW
ncbi:MAG: M13 family metallopeptidase [Elusimicrobiales bacterium]